MRDLKTLEAQLAEVHRELWEMYITREMKKTSRLYVTEINELKKRERNLYVNINQERQRKG